MILNRLKASSLPTSPTIPNPRLTPSRPCPVPMLRMAGPKPGFPLRRASATALPPQHFTPRLAAVRCFVLLWRPSIEGTSVCVVRRQDRHFPNCSLCEPGQPAYVLILFELLLTTTSSSGMSSMGGFSLLLSLAFSS